MPHQAEADVLVNALSPAETVADCFAQDLDESGDHRLDHGERRHRSGCDGAGQGRGPRTWREVIRKGRIPWAGPDRAADVCERLAALPDQDTARPDPLYRLIALKR